MSSVLFIASDKLHEDPRTLWNLKSLKKAGYLIDVTSQIPSLKERENNMVYKDYNYFRLNKSLLFAFGIFVKNGFLLKAIPLFLFLFINLILGIFKISIFPTNIIKFYIRVFAAVLEKKKSYNIIFCQDINSMFVGVPLKKYLRSKLIFDFHETYMSKLNFKSISRVFIKKILRYLTKNANVNILVSEGHLAYYKRFHILQEAVIVPNLPFVDKIPSSMKINKTESISFLSQGSYGDRAGMKYDNLSLMIKVWKQLSTRNAKFFIMHRSKEKLEIPESLRLQKEEFRKMNIFLEEPVSSDKVIKKIMELGINVGFLGYPNSMFEEVDLIRLCSPNKFGEYINAGLCVLAADNIDFIVQVIKKYDIGFIFKADDENSLKSVVEQILQNPELVLKKQKNALESVKELNYFHYFKEIFKYL